MRLWEVKHPYYCNDGNYYSNEPGAEYKRWSDFVEAEGDADFDMNLVFRWDWYEDEDWGSEAYTGGDNYRNGLLKIYIMGQRKGLYRFAVIQVCRADEPSVLEYLKPRFDYLMNLWSPLNEGAPK